MADAFNLLQMYQDDDDDDNMEDAAPTATGNHVNDDMDERESAPLQRDESLGGRESIIEDLHLNDVVLAVAPSRLPSANSTPNWTSLRPPTPHQATSLVIETTVTSVVRVSREKPAIVDYGHDDVAMSPEPEDGEVSATSSGRVMYGKDLETTRGVQQRTPTVSVQTMITNNQDNSPQLPASVAALQDANNIAVKDPGSEVQDGVEVTDEDRKVFDPLDKFLPPPPQETCSDELQEKINKFLALKRQGKSFNVEVRNRKDYRNPDFLRHAVRYQDIDEIGSCFNKDVFDPHGYDESDFYDALEAAINHERERKEQERKKSQKVEFVTGATQTGTIGIAQKAMVPSSSVPNLPTGAPQSSLGEVLTREGRQNKKSKWDKVDGDRKNLFSGGHENLSAVGARAALLSAANAGAGYAMFAQQNRRETEDKRTSDKRLDRKS